MSAEKHKLIRDMTSVSSSVRHNNNVKRLPFPTLAEASVAFATCVVAQPCEVDASYAEEIPEGADAQVLQKQVPSAMAAEDPNPEAGSQQEILQPAERGQM